MLIIDALNIRMGGGLILLDYLLNSLQVKKISFIVLVNNETPISEKINLNAIKRFEISNYFSRSAILKSQITETSHTLFCFGNFPPNFKKKNLRIITFFQNYILVPDFDSSKFDIKSKIILEIKKIYLKIVLKNSDFFIFQTPNIKKQFLKGYNFPEPRCLIFPFFNLETIIDSRKKFQSEGFKKIKNDSIFIGYPSSQKNHITLLNAYDLLIQKGIKFRLFLTIPKTKDTLYQSLIKIVEEINSKGGDIINLGNLPLLEILRIAYGCTFFIFPSKFESFGLGLVEAYYMDLKILASDLDYVYEIVRPSLVFNPNSKYSIANSIENAILNNTPNTLLVVENKINELINFLQTLK